MKTKLENITQKIILFLLTVIVVFLLYPKVEYLFYDNKDYQRQQNFNRLIEVLDDINKNYVDTVNWNKSIDGAINGLLDNLDPHSVYISREEVLRNEENFKGRYYGIGIQFDVLDGYITVISVIPGSPSEQVGLQPGDLITEIEGESAYKIKRDEVPAKLKGEKGTKVTVTIERQGISKPFQVTITRNEIPIFALNTYFMQNDSSGYIWINRFAGTTTDELEEALEELESRGMKQLVLDLRGNGGGYLREAVTVAGKFIGGHHLVVYTQGKNSRNNEQYYTDSFGNPHNRDYPLVIIIDYGSASASEIVAGALQDYDRALIVGKNSFGKGLVQNEFPLNNESRLRLTVAKYYTPSGRMIQKPYKGKSKDEYYHEVMGDDSSKVAVTDSTNNTTIYHTENGREVYDGGGIKPDIEIPYKRPYTSSEAVQKLLQKRIFFEVGSVYANKHHEWKDNFRNFFKNFTVNKQLFDNVFKQAKNKKIKIKLKEIEKNDKFINNRIKAEIARSLWGMEKYWQIELQEDNQFLNAFNHFEEAIEIQKMKLVKN